MDDIWIISWFNHTAFDANPIWKSPIGMWPIAKRRPGSLVHRPSRMQSDILEGGARGAISSKVIVREGQEGAIILINARVGTRRSTCSRWPKMEGYQDLLTVT